MGPWAGCLEALCHLTESQAKVPNVGNHVRELISLDTVFGTTRETFVFIGNLHHLLHSDFNVSFLALEKAGGGAHLISLEPHNLEQELLLNLVNDLLCFAFFGGLDGLAELELDVVE